MKQKMSVLFGAMLLTSNMSTFAGDREWATVGKVLTGIAVIHVIDRIVTPPPPQVVYIQQPTVVQSVPVVVYPQPVVYVQPSPVVYYNVPRVIVYTGYPTPVYRHHYHYSHYSHPSHHRHSR